jgi:hypothetical protein
MKFDKIRAMFDELKKKVEVLDTLLNGYEEDKEVIIYTFEEVNTELVRAICRYLNIEPTFVGSKSRNKNVALGKHLHAIILRMIFNHVKYPKITNKLLVENRTFIARVHSAKVYLKTDQHFFDMYNKIISESKVNFYMNLPKELLIIN